MSRKHGQYNLPEQKVRHAEIGPLVKEGQPGRLPTVTVGSWGVVGHAVFEFNTNGVVSERWPSLYCDSAKSLYKQNNPC